MRKVFCVAILYAICEISFALLGAVAEIISHTIFKTGGIGYSISLFFLNTIVALITLVFIRLSMPRFGLSDKSEIELFRWFISAIFVFQIIRIVLDAINAYIDAALLGRTIIFFRLFCGAMHELIISRHISKK